MFLPSSFPFVLAVAAILVGSIGPVRAADVPLDGRLLIVRDSGDARARRIRAASQRVPELAATDIPDPRVLGATLEIRATGADGGDTGVVSLLPVHWRGLGDPAGSRGYRYLDRSGTSGFRSIVVRGDADDGRLRFSGAGADVPFELDGSQGDILARLTIGESTFCLLFPAAQTQRNDGRWLRARSVAAPEDCALPACGNGTLDPGEACDDGNRLARDGCSPTCRSEAGDICHGISPESGDNLALELVASGLFQPLWVVAPPGDTSRLFLVEQNGRVRVMRDGILQATPFLDIGSKVSCCGERGLLSLVFHPNYASNRRFFVNYTDPSGTTVVSRWRVSDTPDVADAGSEQILFRVAQDFSNHNGGQLAFGPDGYLYVGMGDGGSGGDPRERAQDANSLLGKLLRVDVDVASEPYHAVPADNPRAAEGRPLGLIWASGLRNPWRFAFDTLTNDLFIADVGQSNREEIDVQPASSTGGENYGWDIFEGSVCFDPPPHLPACPAEPNAFVPPIHEYDHGTGCSITGGFVYRGCRMPDLHGTYFYSDFCSPFVRTLQYVDGAAVNHRDRSTDLTSAGGSLSGVTSFGTDARGEIYITTFGGSVYRIVPEP